MAHFLNKANSFLVRRAPPQREQLRPPSLVGGRAREQRERRRRGRRRQQWWRRPGVQQQRHGGRQPGMPDERKKERHLLSTLSTKSTSRTPSTNLISYRILNQTSGISGSGMNFHNQAPNLISSYQPISGYLSHLISDFDLAGKISPSPACTSSPKTSIQTPENTYS